MYCARSLSEIIVATRHGVSNLGFSFSHGAATRHDDLSYKYGES